MSFHNNDTSPSSALQIVSMTAVTGDCQEVTLIVTTTSMLSTAGKHDIVSADCAITWLYMFPPLLEATSDPAT